MLNKVHGSLLGVMIGDALGMPVETMYAKEIREKLGPLGITGFTDPMQTRNDDTKNMKAGDTTDDWQLTAVVAKSLIQASGWDQRTCIDLHVQALQNSTFGWGKGSVGAIRDITLGKRTGIKPPPYKSGVGLGNGIIMKIAPLALAHALMWKKQGLHRPFDWKLFGKHVRELGAITHSDARAWISAFAVGMLIVDAYVHKERTRDELSFTLIDISHKVRQFEAFCVPNPTNRTLANTLQEIAGYTNSKEQLLEKFGSRFVCTQTMPFVIGTFMRHMDDFQAGVLEAVNAGGDTDTNAAIVGSLIGARVGTEGIPSEWAKFRHEYLEAGILAAHLVSKFG